MKYQQVLTEVSESKKVYLIYTNTNEGGYSKNFVLDMQKLNRIKNGPTLLKETASQLYIESDRESQSKKTAEYIVLLAGACEAVANVIIQPGVPIGDQRFIGLNFEVELKFGEMARGINIEIAPGGAVNILNKIDGSLKKVQVDMDGAILSFKEYVNKTLGIGTKQA